MFPTLSREVGSEQHSKQPFQPTVDTTSPIDVSHKNNVGNNNNLGLLFHNYKFENEKSRIFFHNFHVCLFLVSGSGSRPNRQRPTGVNVTLRLHFPPDVGVDQRASGCHTPPPHTPNTCDKDKLGRRNG
jgi:hypothetical protein